MTLSSSQNDDLVSLSFLWVLLNGAQHSMIIIMQGEIWPPPRNEQNPFHFHFRFHFIESD